MKKPLKVAAWSAIISLAFGVLMIPFSLLAKDNFAATVTVSVISSLVGAVLGVLFLNGFLVLGKKYNNSLLTVMSWIGIVLAIIGIFVGIFANILLFPANVSAQSDYGNIELGGPVDNTNLGWAIGVFIVVWLLVSVLLGAYSILWGIGIKRLEKNNVELSKVTGILMIVAGATYIIFVGFLVSLVAWIFEIVLLFKASQKLEGRK